MLNSVPLNTNPSSAGSNLLTKRKSCKPLLLQIIGERTMGLRSTRAGASQAPLQRPTARSKNEVKEEPKDTMLDEVDIYAAPLSSDEEDEKTSRASAESLVSTKVAKRPKFSPPQQIKSPASKPVKDGFSMPEPFELFSVSPQPTKKRKLASYSKNIHTTQEDMKAETDDVSSMLDDLPDPQDLKPARAFKVPRTVLLSGRENSRKSSRSAAFKPPATDPLEEPISTGPKFRMPDILLEPDSSAPSTLDSIFDIPPLSQEVKRRRSGSTSSLSSHASVDLDLSLEKQREMAHDDSGDGLDGVQTTRCRLCSSRVEQSVYDEFVSRYRKMNIRQQMIFCQAHKMRQAQRTWDERGYPEISWPAFEENRIPKHVPHLTKVLHRKMPSFYQSKLDSVVHDTKASRKAINHYLKNGILDVAKQGYYGPRGARIMGHAITTSMDKALEGQLLRDKVVRAVGVGAYITTVLIPELMVELVKEDMGFKDNEQAMRMLEESTDIGALLSADDDEVVLRGRSREL
jgi:RTC4-like domain